VKCAADATAHSHPWQKHLKPNIGKAFFNLSFPVHLRPQRIPAKARFYLQCLLRHLHTLSSKLVIHVAATVIAL
jgi:hypothetical protein